MFISNRGLALTGALVCVLTLVLGRVYHADKGVQHEHLRKGYDVQGNPNRSNPGVADDLCDPSVRRCKIVPSTCQTLYLGGVKQFGCGPIVQP